MRGRTEGVHRKPSASRGKPRTRLFVALAALPALFLIAPVSNAFAAPKLTITDARVTEGNRGTRNAVFKIRLSSASARKVTVRFATAPQSANAGLDYVGKTGTIVFNPGQRVKTLAVAVKGDTVDELNESFSVKLSRPVGARIGHGIGKGTIVDDDPSALSIDDVTATETSGGTTATFTISLSTTSAQEVIVYYSTGAGSAAAGTDFTGVDDWVGFVGLGSRTVSVAIPDDALDEDDETFTVTLRDPQNAVLGRAVGTGTIVDDDATPSVEIEGTSVREGGGQAVVRIKLSEVSGRTVQVGYATQAGTATSGVDYQTAIGTATIAPGTLSYWLPIPISNDTGDEDQETFRVALTSAQNAVIAAGEVLGFASYPGPTAGATGLTAGPDGNLWFLNSDELGVFRLGSADFGTVTAWPLDSSIGWSIVTGADGNLWFPKWNALTRATPGGTMTDFPTPRGVNIRVAPGPDGNLWFIEDGGPDTSDQIGRMTLDGQAVDFDASVGDPYGLTAGPDGNIWFSKSGSIVRMTRNGTDTSFPITSYAVGMTLGADGNLWYTASNQKIGRFATTTAAVDEFPVSSSGYPRNPVLGPDGNVWFITDTKLGRATPGGTITEFPLPPATGTAVAFAVGPDGNFWYTRNGSNDLHRIDLAVASAIVTVIDDDAAPSLSLAIYPGEGITGSVDEPVGMDLCGIRRFCPRQATGTLAVALNGVSKKTVVVDWATQDAGATAGADYVAASGTLTFLPGETRKLINVTVLSDGQFDVVEGTEDIGLRLSNPAHAVIGDGDGVIHIVES
jgi:streptogramin lyase